MFILRPSGVYADLAVCWPDLKSRLAIDVSPTVLNSSVTWTERQNINHLIIKWNKCSILGLTMRQNGKPILCDRRVAQMRYLEKRHYCQELNSDFAALPLYFQSFDEPECRGLLQPIKTHHIQSALVGG